LLGVGAARLHMPGIFIMVTADSIDIVICEDRFSQRYLLIYRPV